MNLEDERKLKFDRRLMGRQDWLDQNELDAELAAIPDAADKIFDPAEEEAGSDASAPAAEEAPAGSNPLA